MNNKQINLLRLVKEWADGGNHLGEEIESLISEIDFDNLDKWIPIQNGMPEYKNDGKEYLVKTPIGNVICSVERDSKNDTPYFRPKDYDLSDVEGYKPLT